MVTFRNGASEGETSFPGRSPQAAATGAESPHNGAESAARQFGAHLEELRSYVELYAAAHADLVRTKIREAAVKAALGTAAGIAGLAAIVVCVYMALRGIAGGLGELLGNRAWAGDLIVGAGLLIVVGVAAKVFLSMQAHAAARRTKDEYARRRQAIARR